MTFRFLSTRAVPALRLRPEVGPSLVILLVALAAPLPAASAPPPLRAARRGSPWVHLEDGRAVEVSSRREPGLAARLAPDGDLRARSLAAADVDGDGVPDLVCGYAEGGRGRIVLLRGNVDPLRPRNPEIRERKRRGELTAAPFHSDARSLDATAVPDLLLAGDFDADGDADLATAELGRDFLEWHRGDGAGSFAAPTRVDLPGTTTAAATGELDRADGLSDVVVAVEGGAGPELVVFESPEGALAGEPERVPIPVRADALLFARLGEPHLGDLILLGGGRLWRLAGRDRQLSRSPESRRPVEPPRVEPLDGSGAVVAAAFGRFDWTPDGELELAVLRGDGRVDFLRRGAETGSSGWELDRSVSLGRPFRNGRLQPARLSTQPGEDLLVFDPTRSGVDIVLGEGAALRAQQVAEGEAVPPAPDVTRPIHLDVESPVAAILPVHLGPMALHDLVFLPDGRGSRTSAPIVVTSTPASTFTVSTTNNSGGGSLAQAIADANASAGADTIDFDFPGAATYFITTNLPAITDPVMIDGSTAGAGQVLIDGTGFGSSASGLRISAGSSAVYNLIIRNYGGSGITLYGAGNDLVRGCKIGTDPGGTSAAPNGWGMFVQTSTSDTIGGLLAGEGNLISGNTQDGIYVILTGGHIVQGNRIGTNAAGTAALGNGGSGISVAQGGGNAMLIGGPLSNARNVISGNALDGIRIGAGSGETIQGNYIGIRATGSAAIPNGGQGIDVGTGTHTIGGTSTNSRNVISGNSGAGIRLDSGPSTTIQGNYVGTDPSGTLALPNHFGIEDDSSRSVTIGGAVTGAGNLISGNAAGGIVIDYSLDPGQGGDVIQGNLIGTTSNGLASLFNGGAGVSIAHSNPVQIGGSTVAARNVLSGNVGQGISVLGLASGVTIRGNYIGLDRNGSGALPNTAEGISLNSAGSVTIGGTGSGEGNVISGNTQDGVRVLGSTSTTLVFQGNLVGLDAAGTAARGNGRAGLRVDAAASPLIGDWNGTSMNVLSGNSGDGITMMGDVTNAEVVMNRLGTDAAGGGALGNAGVGLRLSGTIGASVVANLASGNTFAGFLMEAGAAGNSISACRAGTSANGTVAIPNNHGVAIMESPGNTISGCLLSGNSNYGFWISGAAASGNVVTGCKIGTNLAGTASLPNLHGVGLMGPSNTVGGTTTAARNVISGNGSNGMMIGGANAHHNQILGNFIGTTASGTLPLGNTGMGVLIYDASDNSVGGSAAGSGNVVSGNGQIGVYVNTTAGSAARNQILGNAIGTTLGDPTLPLPNGVDGVKVAGIASNNVIGGTMPGAGNAISFNVGRGVDLIGGTGNAIRGNAFRSNGSLPVDLSPGGATANDPLDVDTGTNNLQNHPVLTDVWFSGGMWHAAGVLDSNPNAPFTVDVYSNPVPAWGGGQAFRGSVPVVTDSTGHAVFVLASSSTISSPSAAATDGGGNSSEFSPLFSSPTAPGEASPAGDMTAREAADGGDAIAWTPAGCLTTDHAIYSGSWSGGAAPIVWSGSVCALGTSGSATVDLGDPEPNGTIFFVVVGENGAFQGSFGRDSDGNERPEAVELGACDLAQALAGGC